jgi:hypothetical protein
VQVCPIKSTLKSPGTKLSNLKYDKQLCLNCAFKFYFRRYIEGYAQDDVFDADPWDVYDRFFAGEEEEDRQYLLLHGWGLHSSTLRLNVNASCGTAGAFRGYSGVI